MDHEYKKTELSRSIMSGVFSGLIAVVSCMLFEFIYRSVTGYSGSAIVNVNSIVFILMILFIVGGLIYDVFHHYLKHPNLYFILVAVLGTAITLLISLRIHESGVNGIEGLVIGITLISGLLAAFLIPALYKSEWF